MHVDSGTLARARLAARAHRRRRLVKVACAPGLIATNTNQNTQEVKKNAI